MNPDSSAIFPFGKGSRIEYYIVGLHTAIIPREVPTRNSNVKLQPYDMYYHSYVYDNHVYVAFLPEPLDVVDGVLRCLRYTWSNFPIEAVAGGRFRLSPELVEQWDSLAAVVLSLKSLLVEMVGRFSATFPLNIREPAPPTAYRYNLVLSSETKLRRSALAAKAAFYYNLAFISYMAALCSTEADLESDCPNWVMDALRRNLLSHAVFNSLKNTWVFDLRARRKGAFVNAALGMHLNKSFDSTQWLEDIPRFLKVVPNMPFWLRYAIGAVPLGGRYALARQYLPTKERVLEAWQKVLTLRAEVEALEIPQIIDVPEAVDATEFIDGPLADQAPSIKRPRMRGAAFPAFVQALDAYIRGSLKLEDLKTKSFIEHRLFAPVPVEIL